VVDSHCHLAGTEFAADLEAVVQRARAAGVVQALVVLAADDQAEIERAQQVRAAWAGVRFAAGVHPHAAAAFAADPAEVVRRVEAAIDKQPHVRAVGEIGLDYHYDFAPPAVQQAVFRHQIRLARQRGLPIVIHTRKAEEETFRILATENASEVGGVFHCFTGDRKMAQRALDMGFYISFAGIVTFPQAHELKAVARAVPLERLLIETDSPYLAPVPYRGRRNEPSLVVRIAETVAELRGVAPEVVATAAVENFARLFAP
jgi:TatD DNase family protein